jgi:hypothetical protein
MYRYAVPVPRNSNVLRTVTEWNGVNVLILGEKIRIGLQSIFQGKAYILIC